MIDMSPSYKGVIIMKILIIVSAITLLFTSLACGSESSESEPLVNIESTTESTTEEAVESKQRGEIKEGQANLIQDQEAEDVIMHVKGRLADETDCGFLLEEDSWLVEYNKSRKSWSLSVESTDPERSGSYSWTYFAYAQSVATAAGQEDCYLQDSSLKSYNAGDVKASAEKLKEEGSIKKDEVGQYEGQ
jgi:hypothetical protein